jgi:hypothetical protein
VWFDEFSITSESWVFSIQIQVFGGWRRWGNDDEHVISVIVMSILRLAAPDTPPPLHKAKPHLDYRRDQKSKMLNRNLSSFVWGLFISSITSVLLKATPAICESSSSSSSWSRLKTAREMTASSDLGGGTPPWQSVSGSGTIQEQKKYDDVPPIVFSSNSCVPSPPKTQKDKRAPFSPTSNLVIALTCKDGLVVISTVPMSPHLNSSLLLVNDTAVPILTHLSPSLAGATAGYTIDCQVMRHKIHRLVDSILGAKGDLTGPALLARRLADSLQVATQTIGGKAGRMLVVSILVYRWSSTCWQSIGCKLYLFPK